MEPSDTTEPQTGVSMSDFQAVVENALNADNIDCNEMDTMRDKVTQWQRICATGIAAVSAGCTAWLQLTAAAVVLNSNEIRTSANEKSLMRRSILNQLIKENPSAASLCDKTRLHWDHMNTLWSSNRAVGNTSATFKERHTHFDLRLNAKSYDVLYQSTDNPSSTLMHDVVGSPNMANATSNEAILDISASQHSASSSKSKGKRKRASDVAIERVAKNMATSLEHLSRAIVESADILANKIPRPTPNSADLFNAVLSLDLPADYLLECYKYLSKNDLEANMFLGATQEYRGAMLTMIMKDR